MALAKGGGTALPICRYLSPMPVKEKIELLKQTQFKNSLSNAIITVHTLKMKKEKKKNLAFDERLKT